jgi:tight adherence protein C
VVRAAAIPAALAATSALLVVRGIQVRGDAGLLARMRGELFVPDAGKPQQLSLAARVGRSRLAARVGATEVIDRRLELAGRPVSLEAIQGLRLLLAASSFALGLTLVAFAPYALALVPIAVVATLRLPAMVLARLGSRRQDRIGAHVADLVELLVATTEAGLSPLVAFRRSAEVLKGPLGEELREAMRQIDLGVPWRVGMTRMAGRCDVPSLRRLVAALGRSQRLGTTLGSTLRTVAADLRAERRVHAEEVARRAPIKMLFPLVFLILPAFLLLTVGPVVLATMRSLR